MPISGIVVRLTDRAQTASFRAAHHGRAWLELGVDHEGAMAAVIDAPDYGEHDALLDGLRDDLRVCAIDIVFHDFSDVSEFPRLPKTQRASR